MLRVYPDPGCTNAILRLQPNKCADHPVTFKIYCTRQAELAKVLGTHPDLAALLRASNGAVVVYKANKTRNYANGNAPIVTLSRRSDGKRLPLLGTTRTDTINVTTTHGSCLTHTSLEFQDLEKKATNSTITAARATSPSGQKRAKPAEALVDLESIKLAKILVLASQSPKIDTRVRLAAKPTNGKFGVTVEIWGLESAFLPPSSHTTNLGNEAHMKMMEASVIEHSDLLYT